MILKGLTYIKDGLSNRYIDIRDGKIASISRSRPSDTDIFEWDGVILPAGIDLHVHFRDPGDTAKEDFQTGTLSAAFGGVTTVLDMPNNHPPTDTPERLKDKIRSAGKNACIDFGLYGMVSEGSLKMSELTTHFKVYMSSSTGVEGGYDSEQVKDLLRRGCHVAFHCEDPDMFGEPGDDLPGYNEERSAESEVSAIGSLINLPDGKKRVCHVSTRKSIELARKASCVVEVTPHHLILNEEALLGPFGKVNPPLRGMDEQYELWESFERGEIDVLASDHAPHLMDEKDVDFGDAPAGLPGVETMYPLMLNYVSLGKISLSTVVKAMAERPGELLGCKKGRIAEGYHADMVLVDFREVENIHTERLHSKADWTPYLDFRAIFPRHVISRGEFVVRDREFVGKRGRGEYVTGVT